MQINVWKCIYQNRNEEKLVFSLFIHFLSNEHKHCFYSAGEENTVFFKEESYGWH